MTAICGAKTRGGTPCKRAPMPNGRCNLHGGKTPSGIASPHFKTGRYSKYLPEDLLRRFQEARHDPELLALRDEIALLDVRLGDLLSQAMAEEPDGSWVSLQTAWMALETALKDKDPGRMVQSMDRLGGLIQGGRRRESAWAEIHRVVEQRRKLVDTERKRLVELDQQVTAQQAMTLVAALSAAVQRCVPDRTMRAAISAEFVRLLEGGQRRREASGGTKRDSE